MGSPLAYAMSRCSRHEIARKLITDQQETGAHQCHVGGVGLAEQGGMDMKAMMKDNNDKMAGMK
jgi:hypothetical protein